MFFFFFFFFVFFSLGLLLAHVGPGIGVGAGAPGPVENDCGGIREFSRLRLGLLRRLLTLILPDSFDFKHSIPILESFLIFLEVDPILFFVFEGK